MPQASKGRFDKYEGVFKDALYCKIKFEGEAGWSPLLGAEEADLFCLR